jgi:hypothetical protein
MMKKKPTHTEHREQCGFINMLKCIKPELNDYWFAVPNGGKRDIKEAVRIKKEGGKKGIPDWIMLYPNSMYCGLLIEFKRPDGKGVVSKDQKRIMASLSKVGYLCEIALTKEQAWSILEEYLSLS